MKVLHVETGRNLYGGALQVLYLLRGLRERGVENVLVCEKRGRMAEDAAGCAILFPITVHGDLDVSFALKLKRIMSAEKPDVVHLHSRRGADVYGLISARLSGLKVVVSRRVDNPEPAALARLKYGACDRVITISEAIRDVLIEEGVSADKITCVHSAVDTALFQPGKRSDCLRREFGLPERASVLGVTAQLIRRKGHDYLLEALPAVLQEFPDTKVLFFGRGPLEAELKARVHAKELEEAVTFAGFRDDMPRLMPCLDVLVHPALMEGLGVSLLQATASGVPIIASKVGGIPEVVRHGENGFLVQPADPRELEGRIRTLLKDRQLARRMGEAGRRIAEEEFSIDRMVEGNLKVYAEILGK